MSQRQRKARAKQRRHATSSPAARRVLAVGGAALGVTLVGGGVAQADTFTVTTNDPTGDGSLAQAILNSNDSPGADTILFASNVTGQITLDNDLPGIYGDVDIQGPGAGALTIDGNDNSIFQFVNGCPIEICGPILHGQRTDHNPNRPTRPSGRLIDAPDGSTISGLTIQHGSSKYGGGVGAAGWDYWVNVTLDHVVIQDNSGLIGGGVGLKYGATVDLKDSTVSGNSADSGGGLYDGFGSYLYVERSTVSDNSAISGGGLAAEYGPFGQTEALVVQSTISGNQAPLGAGAYSNGALLGALNSTIANNQALDPTDISSETRRLARQADFHLDWEPGYQTLGGGVLAVDGLSALVNSTISGNTADVGAGVVNLDSSELVGRPVGDVLAKVKAARSAVRERATREAAANGADISAPTAPKVSGYSAGILVNTIDAGNVTGDYGGDLLSFGYSGAAFSLVQSPYGLPLADLVDGSNITGDDPQLGELKDNGGPTETMLPGAGSPVIDHGVDGLALDLSLIGSGRAADVRKLVDDAPAFGVDQRGFTRPVGAPAWIVDDGEGGNLADGSDIGAVELQPVATPPNIATVVPVITSVAPANGNEGTHVVITGDRFNGATRVYFGNTPATSFSVDGFNQITAVAPAGTGAVDVHVTTPEGTSSSVAADKFTYVDNAEAPSTTPATHQQVKSLLAKLTSVLLSLHNDQLAFIDQFSEPGTAIYGIDLTFNTGNASAVKRIHLASKRVSSDHAGAVRVRIHLSKRARKIIARHPGAKLSVRSRFVSKATGQAALSKRTLRHPRHRHHG